jgi:hypothetical protein
MQKISAIILAVLLFLPASLFAAQLDDDTLSKKQEGYYVTGLPLINYTSDDGFGYGARVYLYNNGAKDVQYFNASPYFMQLYAQAYFTTNGVQYHELNLDMPYLFGSKFRLKTAFAFDKNINNTYFGTGADTAKGGLTDPYSGTHFKTYKSYYNNFLYPRNTNSDRDHLKWNNYSIFKPTYYAYLFRDITDNFKVMAGGEFKYVFIGTWDNEFFGDQRQSMTKLTYDNQTRAGGVPGFDGGWSNFVRLGISYDTRDFEPDPKNGYYVDYCFEGSTIAVGSEYEYVKNNLQGMYFYNIIDGLVVGARLAYTTATKDIPFYEMGYFGFSLTRREGLGSNRTLHGFKKNRFVGRTMTLANIELRWQFWEVTGWGQRFGFKVVGFYDTGNAYNGAGDPIAEPRFGDYHHSGGGGLVIAWNLSTIIHFYWGVSKEDNSVSVDFDHTF